MGLGPPGWWGRAVPIPVLCGVRATQPAPHRGEGMDCVRSWLAPQWGPHPRPVRALFSSCPKSPTKAATRVPGTGSHQGDATPPAPPTPSTAVSRVAQGAPAPGLRTHLASRPLWSPGVLIPCGRLFASSSSGARRKEEAAVRGVPDREWGRASGFLGTAATRCRAR